MLLNRCCLTFNKWRLCECNLVESVNMSHRRGGKRWQNRGGMGNHGAFETQEQKTPLQRAPPGLRGRDIGLFYRNQQKKRSSKQPPKLELPEDLKRKIAQTLSSLEDFTNDSLQTNDKSFTFEKEYLDIVSVTFDEKLNESIRQNCKNRPADVVQRWNEKLREDHAIKQNDDKYKKMLEFRRRLPTYEKRKEILELVKSNQVCVISGETGCGKTTQVGQLILEEACAQGCGGEINIIITQPRRVAATSVAARMAAERGEALGQSIGYSIRLENVSSRNYGSIELVTTGILLQRLQSDPGLSSISHVILDEVHERDSLCDMLMAIMKKIINKRKDLKLILMSATIDAERFCRYYGGCPLLEIPGLMFPVTEFYLEDALELTGYDNFQTSRQSNHRRRNTPKYFEEEKKQSEYRRLIKPYINRLRETGRYGERTLDTLNNPSSEDFESELIVAVIKKLARGPEGAILVFVPGFVNISQVCSGLQKPPHLPPHVLFPLHSRLNSLDQNAIFTTPPPGVRKIIVATNIAETSITIDDVVYVVDSGKMKITGFDVDENTATLQPMWVSKANARQRRGRAGRVKAGECWKLYTRAREDVFDERPAPEILRTPLHEPILSALLLRLCPASSFLQSLPDPPQPAYVETAIKLLQRMRILDDRQRLTPLGVHVARLPVAPGAARMLLLSALLSAVGPAAAIAAIIAFRDPFLLPIGKEDEVQRRKLSLSNGLGSDLLVSAKALKIWRNLRPRESRRFCEENFLSWRTLEMLDDMQNQFGQLLYGANFLTSPNTNAEDSNLHSNNQSLVKALIVAGLYPNVATYRGRTKLQTDENRVVVIHPGSVNIVEPPTAARLVYRLKQLSTKLFLHDTSPAHALPLLFFGDNYKISSTNTAGDVLVEIGGGQWSTSSHTANLLCRLRNALDNILQSKLKNPGPIDWNGPEGSVLMAIIHLVTAEDDPESLNSDNFDSDMM